MEGLGKEEIFKFKEPCIRAMRCRMPQNVTLDKRDRDLTLKLAALWLANRGTDDKGWLFRLAKDYVPKIKAQVKDDWAVNEVYRRLISAFENFLKYTDSRNLKTFFEHWQRYLEVSKAAKEANAWRDDEEVERQRYLEKERQERRRIIEMQLRYGEWWDIASVEQGVPYINHGGEVKPLSDVSLARYARWLMQVRANGGRPPKWGRRDDDAEMTEAPTKLRVEYKPQQRPPEAEKAEAPAKLNIQYIRTQPAPATQKPQQPSPVARKSHRHDMMEEKIRQGAERLKSYEIIVDESLGSRARISPRVRIGEGLVIPLRSYDSYAYTAWLNQTSDEIATETIPGYAQMSEEEKTKALFAKAKQLISGIGSWTSRGTDSQSAPAGSE